MANTSLGYRLGASPYWHLVCIPLREEMPTFPQDFNEATWESRDSTYIKCMHPPNFYDFKSSMQLCLQPGPATKSNLGGVYMYPATSLSHARSSSGYRVYSCFFNDCYFGSVVYECAFWKELSSTVGSMAAGNGQLAARPDTFHVVNVWVHCLHYTEMEDCGKAWLTVNADFFDTRYEVTHSTS
jgi:hypothetical protein